MRYDEVFFKHNKLLIDILKSHKHQFSESHVKLEKVQLFCKAVLFQTL